MAIYEIHQDSFTELETTSFIDRGIYEREDLQRLLRRQIDIISPKTLVIAEEFSDWKDSGRSIDLLALDNNANIVVIELKRTGDGGHMELQAVRYAAMIANLTFSKVIEIYKDFLISIEEDSSSVEQKILDFLGWDSIDEESFAQDTRIVLASQDFSKEITSTVLWLNSQGLDIRCVRMQPYLDGERTLLDVQTVIPLAETEQYKVQIREKQLREKQSRISNRDLTKYDLTISGETYASLNKRYLMYNIIKTALVGGMSPKEIIEYLPHKTIDRVFVVMDGVCNDEQVRDYLMLDDPGGKLPRTKRYFCLDSEILHIENKTYVLSNQWGKQSIDCIFKFVKNHPDLGLDVKAIEN